MIIENLYKNYPGFSLQCDSLIIDAPGLYKVSGKNGSGKTTFLKLISHLEKKYKGNINTESVSWYFQNKIINFHLSFNQNIKLLDDINRSELDYLLCLLECEHLINNKITDLSIGERQRLELITVLAREKDIYVLDEPFSAIDNRLKDKLSNYLMSKSDNHVVIFTDHTNSIKNANKINIKNGKIISTIGHSDSFLHFNKLNKKKINFNVFRYMTFNKFNMLLCIINLSCSFSLLIISSKFSSAIFKSIPKVETDYIYVYEKYYNHKYELDKFINNEGIIPVYYHGNLIINNNNQINIWVNKYPNLNFEYISTNVLNNLKYKLSSPFHNLERLLRYCAIFSLLSSLMFVLLLFKINFAGHKIFHNLISHYNYYLLSFYFMILAGCLGAGYILDIALNKLLLK